MIHFFAERSGALQADDKETWHKTEVKKFQGQWTTSRECKTDKGNRLYELNLEFADGKLEFFTAEEEGAKSLESELTVVRVEQAEGAPRIVLSTGKVEKESVVYYDFQGQKLILVGNCPINRPFEGFPLSGEYKRLEKPMGIETITRFKGGICGWYRKAGRVR